MKKHLAVAIGAALALAGAGIAEAAGRSGGGHSGGNGARHNGGHSGGGGARHSGGHSGGHSHGHYRPHYYGSRVVVVGSAFYGYGYPGYYYPPALYNYAPPPAPVYIEQGPAGAQGEWFYCAQYRAYYPQVQQCPGGWQRVAPQPH